MKVTTRLAMGAALLLMTAVALAGQLEPPPGPVAPTGRVTLFGEPPFTITEPGSYVLKMDFRDCLPCDDLPTDGIIIAASDVTLDLDGFAVVGAPDNSLSGIVVMSGVENVSIVNGVIRDWEGHGLDDQSGDGVRVEGVRALNNGGTGIVVGVGGIVSHSSASANEGAGIVAAPGSVVSHCTATGNGQDGIVAQPTAVPSGSVISDCSARGNGAAGILAGDGTTIADCAVSVNAGHGISAGLGCTIRGNSSVTNGGDGIAAFDSLVTGNTARFNSGVQINAPDSTVVGNHVGP